MSQLSSRRLISIIYLLIAIAKPLNITVDDRDGPDPMFGGSLSYGDGWVETGIDRCQCVQTNEFHKALHATWHKSWLSPPDNDTSIKQATLTFSGSAVYVYCIMTHNSDNGISGNSDMSFFIDGAIAGTFSRDAPTEVTANTLVFTSGSLAMGEHTLTIQNGRAGLQRQVVMLLDYVIYTTDNGLSVPETIISSPSDYPPLSTMTASANISSEPSSIPVGDAGPSDRGRSLTLRVVIPVTSVTSFFVLATLFWLLWVRNNRPNLSAFAIERGRKIVPDQDPLTFSSEDGSSSPTHRMNCSGDASIHGTQSRVSSDEPSEAGATTHSGFHAEPVTQSFSRNSEKTPRRVQTREKGIRFWYGGTQPLFGITVTDDDNTIRCLLHKDYRRPRSLLSAAQFVGGRPNVQSRIP